MIFTGIQISLYKAARGQFCHSSLESLVHGPLLQVNLCTRLTCKLTLESMPFSNLGPLLDIPWMERAFFRVSTLYQLCCYYHAMKLHTSSCIHHFFHLLFFVVQYEACHWWTELHSHNRFEHTKHMACTWRATTARHACCMYQSSRSIYRYLLGLWIALHLTYITLR